LAALTLALLACATTPKPTLQERLSAMSDEDLVAYYQGVDARLRAVGEGVRRETADHEGTGGFVSFQQTYFVGGDGHRLLQQRTAAEKELLKRGIPRSRWAPRTD
jgi:hypothetical protein